MIKPLQIEYTFNIDEYYSYGDLQFRREQELLGFNCIKSEIYYDVVILTFVKNTSFSPEPDWE